MNKEFKKYDQKAHRIAYIGIETLNKILHEANAKIVFITRDVELSNCYQAYLENIKEEIIPPIIIFVFLLLTRFFSHFHFFIEIASKSMSFPLAMNHGYTDV